ncbi:MAG: nucleoside triphosphate pyrophosphohydrolase [Magnetococcales bacterium]|nr:nucleoside triphosphate pyrophosphohydrolase [Magnetococcales bacterium]
MQPDPTPPDTALLDLIALVAHLRSPEGCPWDRVQTFASLTPHTIEEAYEVVEAVETHQPEHVQQELGDLLFHIVLYSRIAQEEGHFSLGDVIEGVTEKMRRRHPHLYGPNRQEVANQVARDGMERLRDNWEAIKRQEKSATPTENPSVFDGLSSKLPALHLAYKVQQKMARIGFDWPDPAPVLAKLHEELQELQEARATSDQDAIEEEIGDVLFTLANYARHLEVNPEKALRRSILKFQNRFRYIERRLQQEGLTPQGVPLTRLEALWQESKRCMDGGSLLPPSDPRASTQGNRI